MESLNFVDTIIRGAILTGSFFLFLVLERVLPLRRRSQNLATRWTVNAVLTTLAFLTGFLVVRNTALLLTDWTTEHSFGLLHWLPLDQKVESRPVDRTLENMAKNNKNQLCE